LQSCLTIYFVILSINLSYGNVDDTIEFILDNIREYQILRKLLFQGLPNKYLESGSTSGNIISR